MNKRILVAGCSEYEREYTREGLYFVKKNYYLKNLYDTYKIDNISRESLTAEDACLLIDAFTENENYGMVLIALGEGDSLKHTDVSVFKSTLKKIAETLRKKNIPFLFENIRNHMEDCYKEAVKEISSFYNSLINAKNKGENLIN